MFPFWLTFSVYVLFFSISISPGSFKIFIRPIDIFLAAMENGLASSAEMAKELCAGIDVLIYKEPFSFFSIR